MKDILFLAYHFPPARNGAVARFYAYYKHLKKFGYNTVVITVDNFGEINEKEDIYRFKSLAFIPRKPYYKRFLNKRVKRLIYDKFDPTFDFLWRREVKKNINNIIRKYNFCAVVSSFPHSESMYLGLYISQKYNIPLISEFRDGYAYETILNKKSAFTKKYIESFERKVVENSKFVIGVTSGLCAYYKNKYQAESYTVFNGYEEDDFKEIDGVNKNADDGKTRIVNFGSIDISGARDVSFLFKAIANLRDKGSINEDNFEMSLIGKYSKKEENIINEFDLRSQVKIYDSMQKIDGFRLIKEKYDCLILYGLPGVSHNIPSKAFEYIRLGLPIIGICEGNESADLIKSTGTGEVCGFDEYEIAELLKKSLYNSIHFQPKTNEISKYNRKNQVEKFAGILDEKIE